MKYACPNPMGESNLGGRCGDEESENRRSMNLCGVTQHPVYMYLLQEIITHSLRR